MNVVRQAALVPPQPQPSNINTNSSEQEQGAVTQGNWRMLAVEMVKECIENRQKEMKTSSTYSTPAASSLPHLALTLVEINALITKIRSSIDGKGSEDSQHILDVFSENNIELSVGDELDDAELSVLICRRAVWQIERAYNYIKCDIFEDIITKINKKALTPQEKEGLIAECCLEFAKTKIGSYYISKTIHEFGLSTTAQIKGGENALIAIALAAAKHNVGGLCIRNFKIPVNAKTIEGESARIAIALAAAQANPTITCMDIHSFDIPPDAKTKEGEHALVAIALAAAKQNGQGLSSYIQLFGIPADAKTKGGENALLTIAIAALKQNWLGAFRHLDNYGFKRVDQRLRLFLQIFQANPMVACQENRGLAWELQRIYPDFPIEVMQQLAENPSDWKVVSKALEKWCDTFFPGFKSSKLLAKISSSPPLQQKQALSWLFYAVILPLCRPILSEDAKRAYAHNLVQTYEIRDPSLRFGISEMAAMSLHNVKANDYFTVKVATMAGLKAGLQEQAQSGQGSPLLQVCMVLSALKTLRVSDEDIDAIEKFLLPQAKKGEEQTTHHSSLTHDGTFQKAFFHTLYMLYCSSVHKKSLAPLLTCALARAKSSEVKCELHSIRLIPYLGQNQVLDELAAQISREYEQMAAIEEQLDTIKDEIKINDENMAKINKGIEKKRKEFKALVGLSKKEVSEKVQEATKDERQQIQQIEEANKHKKKQMAHERQQVKKEGGSSFSPTNRLKELFLAALGDAGDGSFDNFTADFERTFAASRNPAALLQYTASLKGLSLDEQIPLMSALRRYILGVFSSTHSHQRLADSCHLQAIFAQRGELPELWRLGATKELSTQEVEALHSAVGQTDLEQILRTKILNDDHLRGLPCETIKSFLSVKDQEVREGLLADLESIEYKTEELQAQLALMQAVEFFRLGLKEKSLAALKTVSDKYHLADNHPFQNDLNMLCEALAKNKQAAAKKSAADRVIVVDTDDPIDLLLCGTEVAGSCQNITGNPTLNKCLLGYLLDGKNRLLAIKDGEHIVGRAILRLLIDEQTNQPVLLLERIYPDTLVPSYRKILRDFACERARSLQLPLVCFEQHDGSPYSGTLSSTSTLAPYEYVDADHLGVQKGQYKILCSYLLYTPE